jgi:hypothetical protein
MCIYHSNVVLNAPSCQTYSVTNNGAWSFKGTVVTYPAQHTDAMAFSMGNYGYVGTGSNGPTQDDFHSWNSTNSTWLSAYSTQPPFASSSLASYATNTAGKEGGMTFTIRDKGYFACGDYYNSYAYQQNPPPPPLHEELWEYNTASSAWTQKTTMPTNNGYRSYGAGFAIGTDGFVGLGIGMAVSSFYKWDGNPYSNTYNQWSQIAAFPNGTYREEPIALKICDKSYVGGGLSNSGYQHDWWEYDESTNSWTQKTSIPYAGGDDLDDVPSFAICCKGYVVTRHGVLLEYDPATDTWTSKGTVPASMAGTIDATRGFSINGKGYVVGCGTWFNELWEWDPQYTITYPQPIASISVSPLPVCAGSCVTFSNASSAGTCNQYNWTFSTGSSITSSLDAAPVVCYSVAGTYTASLTIHNCGGWAAATQTITVCSTPTATISSTTGGSGICPGDCATLTAGGGVTYSWLPAGQTTTSITVCPTVTSGYTVIATNSCGCTDDASNTILVLPTPTITISGASTVCGGGSQTLTASGGVSYSWSTGATTTSITVNPTTATCYTVTGTGANGCTSTAVECATVDCPDFLFEDCSVWMDCDVFTTYTVTTFGLKITEYAAGSGCTGSPTNTVVPTLSPSNTYSISSPNCSYNPVTFNLPSNHGVVWLSHDYPNTIPSWLTFGGTPHDYAIEYWDCSSGNPAQWGIVSGTSPDCITVPSPACDLATRLTSQNTTAHPPDLLDFSIYPNPAENNITLSYALSENQTGIFELYDLYGKLLMTNILAANTKNSEINISFLQDGVYYCRLGNNTVVKKLVVAK